MTMTGISGLAIRAAAGIAATSLCMAANAAFSVAAIALCIDNGITKSGGGGAGDGTYACHYTHNPGILLPYTGTLEGNAQTTIGPRKVGVVATGSATLSGGLGMDYGVRAYASGSLTDRFQLQAQDADGNPIAGGSMDIDLMATGKISLNGTGDYAELSSAELHYNLSVTSGGNPTARQGDWVLDATTGPGEQFITVPISVTVSWTGRQDVEVRLYSAAEVQSKVQADGTVNGEIKFGNSLDWVGISNVRDSQGNPVASFYALSPDTGVVWGGAPPVPEPAAWASLALGLAVLATRRSRRAG